MNAKDKAKQKLTLFINRSDSRCGNCQASVSPRKPTCDIQLGYPPVNGTPGCGVEWKYVASDYVGLRMEQVCAEMRPDLIWNGIDEEAWMKKIQENQKK